MSNALRTFFLVALIVGILTLQLNIDTDLTSTRQLKNYLELAVHDAALALDEEQLTKGNFVFDQVQAEEHLKESLKFHLRLDENLIPLEASFFKHPIEIKYLGFLDQNTIDPSDSTTTISFPYTYSNSRYQLMEKVNGPSVIVVLETISPRYFLGTGRVIRQAVVYEYIMH